MSETPKQEIRRLIRIVNHVDKLSPAGRRWLLSWLSDAESPCTHPDGWAERGVGGPAPWLECWLCGATKEPAATR